MSALSLEDAVAIEGGSLDLEASLPGLPNLAIANACATLSFLANVFLNNLEDRAAGVYIVLTRSSGLACRVRQLDNGACAMLVPAGLIGRLRTLCRTLLRYWNKEHHVAFASSPLDKIAEDQWQVPPRLVSLFDSTESGDQFWNHLKELDDSLDLDPKFDPDVLELMHLGLVFLLCHEFAHVFFRHFEFVASAKQTRPTEVDRLRRGLELQADSFAGTWAITIFLAQMGGDTDVASVARGFLRQSYVVTLIMAMFDAQKKYVGFYDIGDYNHPLIRREIFADACGDQVGLQGQEFYDFWQDLESQGWKRAIEALAELNLEAWEGKFGNVGKDKLAFPLQSMNYGLGAAVFTLQKMLEESTALMKDVEAQVAEFNKKFGTNTAND